MSTNSYMVDTPVFKPTKEEFSRPFSEYIDSLLKKNPDMPMFKVVPPDGWRPRRTPIKLAQLDIACPIKQLVVGTRGSYRCYLVEQKSLTARQFKDIAEDADHAAPTKVRDKEDKMLERAFWSSVTINPPLYGADTPMSLFDERLAYGWNLRHLEGCLLKRPHIPQVPGVTTPMTYFGMWKSFFAWHVEDADLFSINYLHFGAPKVWYCVSPSNRPKFERMVQSLFPDLHRHCKAFMRHKDILLSPSLLRTYGVEYMQAKQEPNEFIVLNAGAYHAGYNTGFNCAEAVNFATERWIEVGRNVQRCKCSDDGVRLSMRLFGCAAGSSASDSEEDAGTSSDASDAEPGSSDEDASGSEDEDAQSSEGEDGARGRRRPRAEGRRRSSSAGAAAGAAAAGAAAAGAAAAGAPASAKPKAGAAAEAGPPAARGPRQTRTALAAAASAAKMRRTHATAEARARLAVQRGRAAKRKAEKGDHGSGGGGGDDKGGSKRKPSRALNRADTLTDSLQRASAASAAIRARAEAQAQQAAAQAAGGDGDEPHAAAAAVAVKQEPEPAAEPLQQVAAAAAAAGDDDLEPPTPTPPALKVEPGAPGGGGVLTRRRSGTGGLAGGGDPDSPTAKKARLSAGGAVAAAAGGSAGAERPSGDAPQVIIGEDHHGGRYFYMVQVLRDHKPKRRGCLVLRWLKEGKDGLFRPSTDTWEEPAGALVGVRTQWVAGGGSRAGGYRLLTLRSRILDTQLVD